MIKNKIILQSLPQLITPLSLVFTLCLRLSCVLFWWKRSFGRGFMQAVRLQCLWRTFFFVPFQSWFRTFSFSSPGTPPNPPLRISWTHTSAYPQLPFSRCSDTLWAHHWHLRSHWPFQGHRWEIVKVIFQQDRVRRWIVCRLIGFTGWFSLFCSGVREMCTGGKVGFFFIIVGQDCLNQLNSYWWLCWWYKIGGVFS